MSEPTSWSYDENKMRFAISMVGGNLCQPLLFWYCWVGNIDPVLEGKNISRLLSGNKLLKFLNSRRKYSHH